MNQSKGEIQIFQTKDKKLHLDVKLEHETVWLTQSQIAMLFATERSVITKHLKNIFSSGELSEKSNVQKMHIPNSDKPVKIYNLDVIISTGYRVNSVRATQFRIWATNVLKNHVIHGYTLNQKRLLEQNRNQLEKLKDSVNFVIRKASLPELDSHTFELLNIVKEYTNSLTLLYQYDNGNVELIKEKKPKFILTLELCQEFISQIKNQLKEREEASNLFGNEMDHRFKGVIGSLYQTFGGKELYGSIEEKAAHLLYLVIQRSSFFRWEQKNRFFTLYLFSGKE